MIAHKHTVKFVTLLMAAAVCLCLCAQAFSSQLTQAAGGSGVTVEYETKLFDTSTIMQVNIIMDEDDWNEMLENAMDEEYYDCDVEINGTTFYHVGIRPKGNTSLSSIANDPTTDRYSFKLEFGHYVEGQTCFGLDKLVLNNNYADATDMKEALVYDMYQYLGADASLYNYAEICVNGEEWGLYLALEGVEDSFLLRNYGVNYGELYKPEGMNIGGMGGGQSGSGGADLNYTDDELDSYETIWDGEVTDSGKKDHKRVIAALKNISEGTDLEEFMDIDNLLRYMAVHLFVVNDDSLSGSMAHNYYLYESDGKLNLIPWDYNLAFGGMGGGNDASGVVNAAIDDAFSITGFFDALMENETYHAQFCAYMRQLAERYVQDGGFDAFYSRVRGQIDELVKSDPTAFYTAEEYETAAKTLYQVVTLRAESVLGQVEGTIPSTDAAQRASDALIDASGIDISVMGTMNAGGGMGGGGRGGFDGQMPERPGGDDADVSADDSERPTTPARPDETESTDTDGETGSSTAPGQGGDFSPPDGGDFDPSQDGGFSPPDMGDFDPDNLPDAPAGNFDPTDMQRPGGAPEESESSTGGVQTQTLIWYGVSLGALLAAGAVALIWRRRR